MSHSRFPASTLLFHAIKTIPWQLNHATQPTQKTLFLSNGAIYLKICYLKDIPLTEVNKSLFLKSFWKSNSLFIILLFLLSRYHISPSYLFIISLHHLSTSYLNIIVFIIWKCTKISLLISGDLLRPLYLIQHTAPTWCFKALYFLNTANNICSSYLAIVSRHHISATHLSIISPHHIYSSYISIISLHHISS